MIHEWVHEALEIFTFSILNIDEDQKLPFSVSGEASLTSRGAGALGSRQATRTNTSTNESVQR